MIRHLGSGGERRFDFRKSDGRRDRSRIVRGRYPEPVEKQKVGSGGQGRNRTNDTLIFSTTESPARRGKAEEAKRVSAWPTEPPRPTEQLSKETIAKTYFGQIKSEKYERYVNVELAVKTGDHLNGHVVSGHIYATGTIIFFNNNSELIIKLSPDHLTRVTYKGSITINGISLTVANINKANNTITIWIIPETIRRTTFGLEGLLSTYYETVNIEFDIHDYNREVRDHSYFMRLAIQEGELGRATTPPNPWVGCIVVKDGNIIGKGHHEQAGRDRIARVVSASIEV